MTIARSVATPVVLVALYLTAPIGEQPDAAVVSQLVAWLVVLVAALAWQVRAVMRSMYPGLRAVEAVVVGVSLLVVAFSTTYVVASSVDPASFTEPVDKVDGLYFTITVLGTVGFGDIAPRTQAARLAVSVQMMVDLILIGVVARLLVEAVHRRRRDLERAAASSPEVAGEPETSGTSSGT